MIKTVAGFLPGTPVFSSTGTPGSEPFYPCHSDPLNRYHKKQIKKGIPF
jgi:hypothetical protein